MTDRVALPRTVLIAVALLALSLALSVYAEVNFAAAAIAVSAKAGFVLGRLLVALSWFAVQAWVLFKLLQGRNWARVLVIVLVAHAVAARHTSISSPVAELWGVAMFTGLVVQTIAEAAAVLLLVTAAADHFAPRASA